MKRRIALLSFSGLLAGWLLAACGSQKSACELSAPVAEITPTMATADHTADPPANQQQFAAFTSPASIGPGCAVPTFVAKLTPTWTVSDTLHISISNASDATNGVATCLGPTTGAATVTAIVGSGATATKLTAALTCK